MNDYKLVPVEPTEAMIDAAREAHEGEAYLPVSLYKAMLAESPDVQGEPVAWQRVDWPDRVITNLSRRSIAEVDNEVEFRPLYAAPQPAEHRPCPDTLIGRTVSMDVSTGDHNAFHRLFGTVVGVEGQDGVILCELDEDNQDKQPAPDVSALVELLEHARCNTCDGSGALYDGHGQVRQCQWCHDRSEVPVEHRKGGGV